MNDQHDFKFKLAVWDRIQKGTATQDDHDLAFKWGDEYCEASRAKASPTDRWMAKRGETILEQWPFPLADSKTEIPHNEVLLFAILYGHSDISNGCLEQFFGNHTGGFAPEMVEGLELINATSAALVVRNAMKLFGTPYPREQLARRELLHPLLQQLDSLSDLYFEAIPEDSVFDSECEKLLAKCGN